MLFGFLLFLDHNLFGGWPTYALAGQFLYGCDCAKRFRLFLLRHNDLGMAV